MTEPRAYPWQLLPKVPRPTIALLRAAAAHLGGGDLGAGGAAAGALLGVEVAARPGPVAVVPRGELLPLLGSVPQVAVVLRRHGGRAVVVGGAAFAAALGRRVLGGPPELAASRPLTRAEEGVVALVALTWLGAADPTAPGAPPAAPLEVAGVTQDLAAAVATLAGEWVAVVEVAVRAGADAATVRVLVPESLLVTGAPTPRAGLRRLERLPVRCAVEIGRGHVAAAALAELGPGDVLFLDDLALHPTRGGPARLRAGGLVLPLAVDAGGTATVAAAPYHALAGGGAPMSSPQSPSSSAERLASLEVEVAAEIGRVVLSGRELAALAPGVVLELRRPLGGPVDVVAAGRLLARGELVDVDGEVGVRVVEVVG